MGPRTPAGSRNSSRSELSTTKLLQAAAQLIAVHGYERTSLVQIAQTAGYSHGLVTLRFGSKDGLLDALLDRMTGTWSESEVMPIVGQLIGVDGIRAVLDAVRASAKRRPENVRALYALMFEAVIGAPALEKRIAAIHAEQHRVFVECLERGRAAGLLKRTVNVEEAASMATSMLRGAAYQWLLVKGFDFDRALVVAADALESLFHQGSAASRTAIQPGSA